MRKMFRGKTLRITVQNPNHKEGGTPRLTLNGQPHPAAILTENELLSDNELTVTL